MKRIAAFILAVIYLSTSMGATVHFHYCMGHLVGWDLADRESRDCISCGMAKERATMGCSVGMKNCCHDEHKHIQNSRAQKPAQGWAEWKTTPVLAMLPSAGWNVQVVAAPAITHPVANGPPLAYRIPIFLRNCNFRI